MKIQSDKCDAIRQADADATILKERAAVAHATAQSARAQCNVLLLEALDSVGISAATHKLCLECGNVTPVTEECKHGN